jgi:hypothetical protein
VFSLLENAASQVPRIELPSPENPPVPDASDVIDGQGKPQADYLQLTLLQAAQDTDRILQTEVNPRIDAVIVQVLADVELLLIALNQRFDEATIAALNAASTALQTLSQVNEQLAQALAQLPGQLDNEIAPRFNALLDALNTAQEDITAQLVSTIQDTGALIQEQALALLDPEQRPDVLDLSTVVEMAIDAASQIGENAQAFIDEQLVNGRPADPPEALNNAPVVGSFVVASEKGLTGVLAETDQQLTHAIGQTQALLTEASTQAEEQVIDTFNFMEETLPTFTGITDVVVAVSSQVTNEIRSSQLGSELALSGIEPFI